jgi:acetyl-CoA C-acetyltransferase
MMSGFRKKIYIAGGYNTTYFGPGRKEFDPKKGMRTFESYLLETAEGTTKQLANPSFDEGVIGSFMSGRFIKQGNLSGFLPYMISDLGGKACTGIEGACGTGGRAIAMAIKGVLSDLSNSTFVAAFEMQNTIKSVYGSDVLAGASYYNKERKEGQAYFFPGVFAERANAYYQKFGYEYTRKGLAKWYEQAILNARKNPKAQEYHNLSPNLYALGMTAPNPDRFIPYLNHYDCSKISDGASSVGLFSKEGLAANGISLDDSVEVIGMGECQGDITKPPSDLTALTNSEIAIKKALDMAKIRIEDIGIFELHDCFTISGILSLEALGIVEKGKAPTMVLEGETCISGKYPVNLSGGLCGFGHPTGSSGVRQMVDLLHQLTDKAENQAKIKKPYGLMVSMGGNDKTVTCLIVAKTS